jgi:hypothetical protein
MDIVLVGGYVGMGKDYFYSKLSDFESLNSVYSFWSHDPNFDMNFFNRSCKNVKLASTLKRDVASILGITTQELESRKELPLDIDYVWKLTEPQSPTYRHVLIDEAEYRRSIEPEYYVRCASTECEVDKLNVITDWRNHNELNIKNYLNSNSRIVTVRIHRDGVNIPGPDLVSEHHITEVPVDILILPVDRNPRDYQNYLPWSVNYHRVW